MRNLQVLPCGPSALRVIFSDRVDEASLARCRGILGALDETPLSGLLDRVPAFGEVLLEFTDAAACRAAEATVREWLVRAEALPAEAARLHEIPTFYDGPDLEALAREKDLSVAEIIRRHAAPVYTVYQIGFSPGFPYLGPLDESLHTPRLKNPRPRIEPGSVAIGGEHTGIYSIASPGGWRIIGRTEVALFSREKAQGPEAFLLRQGDRVRFVPCE